jgi:hypothetical protein
MAVRRVGHQLKPARSVWAPDRVEQASSHCRKDEGLPDGRSSRYAIPIGRGIGIRKDLKVSHLRHCRGIGRFLGSGIRPVIGSSSLLADACALGARLRIAWAASK